MKKKKIYKNPIFIFLMVVTILFLSPFIITFITKTVINLLDGFQVRAQWVNATEVISISPKLQFQFSQDVDPQFIADSFITDPQVTGLWIWLEEDLAIWQSEELIPFGQLLRFGFETIEIEELSDLPKLKPIEWHSYIREPEIGILKAESGGKELFRMAPHSPSTLTRLTNTNGMVIDFTVSPDGEQILFSQRNEQSGIDLWLIDRNGEEPKMILNCGSDRCSSLNWNPKRDEIVFTIEESILENDEMTWDLPVPFILNLVTGETQSIFKDPNQIGYDPVWSSNGQWVTVWKGMNKGIEIIHSGSKTPIFSDSSSEDTGCWSPDERYFFYSNVREEGLPIVSIIYRVEILTGQRDFFTGSELFDLGYNYYYPACYPAGNGVMAAVQVDPKIPQRELWWIKTDGTFQKISDDLSLMVTQYSWSPDGNRVSFLRDTLTGLADGSEIILWDFSNSEVIQTMVDGVYNIQWIP
jgi:hypothetical protein